MIREIDPQRLLRHADVLAPAPKASAHHRPATDDLATDVEITDFAQAFLDLQQRRHEADYDHLADFNRPGALASVQSARQAVMWLGHISNSDRGHTLSLLIAVQSGPGR